MPRPRLDDAALIVVDLQEDFCPPNGALAIPNGRSIAVRINELLHLPWRLRIATMDWHPPNHVSFASSHGPHHKPLQQMQTKNPLNANESQHITLWYDHCVQGTPGAALIPELDQTRIDHVVKKAQDHRVEMFSAFRDDFRDPCVVTSGLTSLLHTAGIRKAYVVGLARDYCVKATALHAAEEGFQTTVVADATKGIDDSSGAMSKLTEILTTAGVMHKTAAETGLM